MVEGDGDQVDWFEEFVDHIREWHDTIIEISGGRSGENTARLLGACGRAFQGFGDELFYPSDLDKASALFHGIISDHAFVDGNKRTATITVILFLAARGALDAPPSGSAIRRLGELAIETATSPGLSVPQVSSRVGQILAVSPDDTGKR